MATIHGTGIEVFPITLGCNTFGWTNDQGQAFDVLDAFTSGGGNVVDTADCYPYWAPGCAGGESEQILGEWLKQRGKRDELIVASKCGAWPRRSGLSAANIAAACDDSLQRLQTDRIDLYYAHHDDQSIPIPEIAGAFDALVKAGKVRAIGISNLSAQRMRQWFDHCAAEGLTRPVALQNEYSLVARRAFEHEFQPVARKYEVSTFPYYSLASGLLTGKYRTEADLEGPRADAVAAHFNRDGLDVVDALVKVAAAHDAKPASVALAWLLARGVTAPIASATTPEQVTDLLAGASIQLTDTHLAALNEASSPFA